MFLYLFFLKKLLNYWLKNRLHNVIGSSVNTLEFFQIFWKARTVGELGANVNDTASWCKNMFDYGGLIFFTASQNITLCINTMAEINYTETRQRKSPRTKKLSESGTRDHIANYIVRYENENSCVGSRKFHVLDSPRGEGSRWRSTTVFIVSGQDSGNNREWHGVQLISGRGRERSETPKPILPFMDYRLSPFSFYTKRKQAVCLVDTYVFITSVITSLSHMIWH